MNCHWIWYGDAKRIIVYQMRTLSGAWVLQPYVDRSSFDSWETRNQEKQLLNYQSLKTWIYSNKLHIKVNIASTIDTLKELIFAMKTILIQVLVKHKVGLIIVEYHNY